MASSTWSCRAWPKPKSYPRLPLLHHCSPPHILAKPASLPQSPTSSFRPAITEHLLDTKHWASLRTQLDQALGFTDLGTNNQGRGKRRPEFEDDPGEKDPGKEGAKNHLEKCFSH